MLRESNFESPTLSINLKITSAQNHSLDSKELITLQSKIDMLKTVKITLLENYNQTLTKILKSSILKNFDLLFKLSYVFLDVAAFLWFSLVTVISKYHQQEIGLIIPK